jgi:preprotein translocase subunit SecD
MTDLEALFREFEKETGEKLNARETRKALAEGLKTSETRIANLQSINRNLCDEGKKKLQENKIGISAATELAGLSEEQQQELLGRQGELTVKSIKEEKKKNVSDSDTEMQAEENVSDSDTILPGQVDIHDYKEIAPNGFSRAEKVATLKQCVKECRMALDFLHDDSREPEVRKTKLLYQTQMEAYGKYIEYLQSDIQE